MLLHDEKKNMEMSLYRQGNRFRGDDNPRFEDVISMHRSCTKWNEGFRNGEKSVQTTR
jgi:hypothetical protein